MRKKKYHADFTNSTKYWISEKAYDNGEVQVKSHDNITGIYQGSAHVM